MKAMEESQKGCTARPKGRARIETAARWPCCWPRHRTPGQKAGRGLKQCRAHPGGLWPTRSARPKGRARIETPARQHSRGRNHVPPGQKAGRGLKLLDLPPRCSRLARSARPKGRARIETGCQSGHGRWGPVRARPKGRARIETWSPVPAAPGAAAAPGQKAGRGLKPNGFDPFA